MTRTYLSGPYQHSRAYSPAVITEGGRIVWLAGHLAPEDENGKSLAGDFDAQVHRTFAKMADTMAKAGGTLDHIVTMTVFITEVRFNTRFVELRKEVFGDSYPASTLVTVAALNRPEMMVEIQATAVVD